MNDYDPGDKIAEYNNAIGEQVTLKNYDKAWALANKALLDNSLLEYKYDYYFWMSKILAYEKKWRQSLHMMGLWIHFNEPRLREVSYTKYEKGLYSKGYEKHAIRLLKKFDREDLFDEFIELSLKTEPKELESSLNKLLE